MMLLMSLILITQVEIKVDLRSDISRTFLMTIVLQLKKFRAQRRWLAGKYGLTTAFISAGAAL